MKMVQFLLVSILASSVFAKETIVNMCVDKSGRAEVTLESQVIMQEVVLEGSIHKSKLVLDGATLPLITEACVWTPGVKSVIRCPHLISTEHHAEVYPKFKKGNALELEKAVIIMNNETLELGNCKRVQ